MNGEPYELDLQAIHQQSDVQLLDDIDSLRSQGISHFVALPQLVVCGDQSSGKSSVLEAISGIPFPTKDNLCTRFATEVILRRTSVEQAVVTVLPGEPKTLRDGDSPVFRKTLSDLSEFGDVVEAAKQFMGINDDGAAFTNDVLRIDMSGPNRPHLTIVDLPGLIHSHNKMQTAEDVRLVQLMVRRYMESSRSIILAIVSAKNDHANQIVLKMAREVDRNGARTLGIITKPDTLSAGSESESAYLSLAQNQDVAFHLGWHVLKNRDYNSRHSTSAERDHEETIFLSQGIWSQLPRWTVAIAALRTRLSKVLLNQVKSELPTLTHEIEQKLDECRTDLRKMGPRRETADEQRRFLLRLAQDFQSLAKAAVDGVYADNFFGDPWSESGYLRRIRAVVQNLSLDFAETMRRRGHRYEVTSTPNTATAIYNIPEPEKMSRDQYLEHTKRLLTRSRGRELPGTFNPLLIADLFHEQSSPWARLAQEHLKTVWAATRHFLVAAVTHLTHQETAESILREFIDPAMEEQMNETNRTVMSILNVYKGNHPISYNHYFTETIQNVRAKRMEDDLTHRLRKFLGLKDGEALEELNFTKLKKTSLISALSVRNEVDMDRYACAEATDCMFAFYKVAMKNVVDNIATQCVEEQIIKSLPELLSPAKIIEMDPTVFAKVIQESSACAKRREELRLTATMLEAGLETCRRHSTAQASAEALRLGAEAHLRLHREKTEYEDSDTQASEDFQNVRVDLPDRLPFPAPESSPVAFQGEPPKPVQGSSSSAAGPAEAATSPILEVTSPARKAKKKGKKKEIVRNEDA